MQTRGYGAELSVANIMFASLFRTFRITRSFDRENQDRTTIDVPVVIADRSRIFKSLENSLAASPLTLPLVTIQRTGVTIANSRITNLHNEVVNQEMEGRVNYDLMTPVPVDISYSVVLVSRWMNDVDMMLGQLLPFFNTDVYVSHRHPKYSNVKYSSQVVMGTSIDIQSQPDVGKDADEIHTATLTFTYKTHIFGGTRQEELGIVNPYAAPVTKIGVEVHLVPFLNPDSGDVDYNDTGYSNGGQDLGQVHSMSSENYLRKLGDGKVKYPEYEQIDWIMDYQPNENGELEPAYDPNQPFGYTPEERDGLTYVVPRHRLYDQEVETNRDNLRMLQSQNHFSQWGFPYQEIETRPWNEVGTIQETTEQDLREQNPLGTEDYTEF